ncbi:MAG: hypothetical protein RI900_1161 [Actinomycetota bacterium]|jgi:hypothetical protein
MSHRNSTRQHQSFLASVLEALCITVAAPASRQQLSKRSADPAPARRARQARPLAPVHVISPTQVATPMRGAVRAA